MKVKNWERWQSYRKDRGQPPWIKVHRRLMRKPKWIALTDAQRGQLLAIWMLAADRNGVIPASPALIKKLCYMDAEPDLNLFIEKGFIDGCQDDANVSSERRQHVTPEEKRIDAATPPKTEEAELFERGKAVLGNNSGGLIARLLKSRNGSIPLARAAIDIASTKQDPREYIGRIIAGPVRERHSRSDPLAGIV